MGLERTLPGLLVPEPVTADHTILENNGKIRPQPGREKPSSRAGGGQRGIRTLETVPRLHTFQACAFDHSATCPCRGVYKGRGAGRKGDREKFGPLQQRQGHPAVLAALLLDAADPDPADFAAARDVGAAAGLQVDLAVPLADAHQPHQPLPQRRHHRHGFHQTRIGQQPGVAELRLRSGGPFHGGGHAFGRLAGPLADAHQSIGRPLIGRSQDGSARFEPAFADALTCTIAQGPRLNAARRSQGRHDG